MPMPMEAHVTINVLAVKFYEACKSLPEVCFHSCYTTKKETKAVGWPVAKGFRHWEIAVPLNQG